MCGVFGVRAPARDVARLTYFGLHALQHRGQESAGIAVSEDGRLTALRDLGLVAQVFDERSLSGLHGELAIGHTRYSTTGGNAWENAQPLLHHGRVRTVALGHNGNLVNAEELRERVGKRLASSSDSEVIAALIADDERPLEDAVAGAMATARRVRRRSSGSPTGRCSRSATLTASARSCSAGSGRPGDRVGDLRARPRRRDVRARGSAGRARDRRRATGCTRCRRSSRPSAARSASSSSSTSRARTRASRASRCTAPACAWASGSQRRRRSRPTSCCRSPTRAPPPRSASRAPTGIPFSEGLIKNRYVGRTFIQPEQGMREQGIRMKFNPLAEVSGQAPRRRRRLDRARLDDAADRAMLFDAGAAEVHVRISSPPVVSPCFYGIDLASEDEMIAAHATIDEVRAAIGATSLAYLSLEGLQAATQRPENALCRACLTRDYPTEIPERSAKLRFEVARLGEGRPLARTAPRGAPVAGRAPARAAADAARLRRPAAGRARRAGARVTIEPSAIITIPPRFRSCTGVIPHSGGVAIDGVERLELDHMKTLPSTVSINRTEKM